jgi:hypothetical protein
MDSEVMLFSTVICLCFSIYIYISKEERHNDRIETWLFPLQNKLKSFLRILDLQYKIISLQINV